MPETTIGSFSAGAIVQLITLSGLLLLALFFVIRAAVASGIRSAREDAGPVPAPATSDVRGRGPLAPS